MTQRLAYKDVAPSAYRALLALEEHVRTQKSGLDHALQELVELTLAVATINAWNRMNIAFRVPAGSYTPRAR